jgi:glycosyltransferase involved in cell wall biosynthesis
MGRFAFPKTPACSISNLRSAGGLKMRVLQLISSSGYYGAEAVAISLSQALQQSGIDSVLGVFRNSNRTNLEVAETAKTKGLSVELVSCNGRADRQAWLAIREVIRRERVDLVHSHGYKSHLYGHFAARGMNCQTVATCHGYHTRNSPKNGVLNFSEAKVWGYRKIEHALLPRFDRVIAVSDEIACSLRTAGVQARRLTVIPNGIDVSEFESARPAPDLEEVKGGRLAVGLVGRLIHGKGHVQLFEVARNILAECPNTVFFVVGDGLLRQRLENLVHEFDIAGDVFFLGKRSDMPQVYAALDIMVLPSLAEGTPMVILEALAARKAVIASNVGGIPEIITDNKTGRLIETGNSRALCEALLCLLNNRELRCKFGGKGNALVRENYSASRMASRYLEEYRKLTNNICPPTVVDYRSHNSADGTA